ncbi:MAG: alpha/beta hydrolase family protein [Streptosporangiaceae bacterium]
MNRHARGGLAGHRPRVLFTVLAAVILAILGTVTYLAVQAIGGRPASAGTTDRPAVKPTASPARSRTPPPAAPPVGKLGDYRVAEEFYTFTEPANNQHGARVLHVTVHFPAVAPTLVKTIRASGAFPLIAFAPGYRQCSGSYRYLLHQWASAGYVVAAVDFPRTNCHTVNPDESDLANQPADVAYVIRRLLAVSARPLGPLTSLISDTKIAVAGHSDGGNTAAAIAGASCCLDRKIRAAIVLAGNEWPWGGDKWFAGRAPPILFVQGTADGWNPPQYSVQLYKADKTGTRYYLDLFGANHFTPYEGHSVPEPIVARVTLDFLDQYVAGQQGRLASMRRAGHVPGLAELVSAGRMP